MVTALDSDLKRIRAPFFDYITEDAFYQWFRGAGRFQQKGELYKYIRVAFCRCKYF
jgi:hypothetical protein